MRASAASTRALEALLGAALALLVVGWLRMRQTDVLPLAPTTIASVAALIAGGNLVEKLPADAAWRRRADVAAALRAAGATEFWIGWGLVPDLEGRVADHLGFARSFTSVGQIYPRSLDHDVVSALVQLAAAPSSLAHTIRLMAGHEKGGLC